jgi:hypothetical protein
VLRDFAWSNVPDFNSGLNTSETDSDNSWTTQKAYDYIDRLTQQLENGGAGATCGSSESLGRQGGAALSGSIGECRHIELGSNPFRADRQPIPLAAISIRI